MAISTGAASAFSAGSGVDIADLKLAAASFVAVAGLMWAAWLAQSLYHGWRERRLSLMDLQWGLMRAAALVMALCLVIR